MIGEGPLHGPLDESRAAAGLVRDTEARLGSIDPAQANAQGKYAHPEDAQDKPVEAGFRGFGRSLTRSDGGYRFATIKPGPVPGPGGALQAPHLVITVFMRGLLKHLVTRVYFPDEPANATDPVLKLVPAERRSTLVARRTCDGRLHAASTVISGSKPTTFMPRRMAASATRRRAWCCTSGGRCRRSRGAGSTGRPA